VPLVFQGEEWGASSPFQFFVDFDSEPELAANVLKGRQSEFAAFGWDRNSIPDPNELATFERSKLNWNELDTQPHREMFEWYRTLIAFRRHSIFQRSQSATANARFDEDFQWLVVERGELTVVTNFSHEQRPIPLSKIQPGKLLLSSKPHVSIHEDVAELPPHSVVVLENG
jgi:maltooligosyltrehalose trehalohydrolase